MVLVSLNLKIVVLDLLFIAVSVILTSIICWHSISVIVAAILSNIRVTVTIVASLSAFIASAMVIFVKSFIVESHGIVTARAVAAVNLTDFIVNAIFVDFKVNIFLTRIFFFFVIFRVFFVMESTFCTINKYVTVIV